MTPKRVKGISGAALVGIILVLASTYLADSLFGFLFGFSLFSVVVATLCLAAMAALASLVIWVFVNWILMLADCLKGDRSDKLEWVLVLIFLSVLGGLMYRSIAYKRPAISK